MQVRRLRLVGFKSFVEATELAVEPGLTGIVGPNGCGKSNLVEALGWVMGETSARRLRAGEMDEVIFSGSANRPARNLAEVALTIDIGLREAPLAFSERGEIEIARRIERGGGSAYRINGREVRARDVQWLFADAASGAHSAALVGHGRLAALIEAKPAERRMLLEEAAGTAGLQARRHETLLKLGAAEDNLARLDDVVATMAAQHEALKRQARQAQRYRRIAEQIRRTEALLHRARWIAAAAEAAAQASELRAADRAVAEATAKALAAARVRDAAEAALPPLKAAAAERAAALQRLLQARAALEEELTRVVAAGADAERRLGQLAADIVHQQKEAAEAAALSARLAAERQALARAEEAAAPARDVAVREARRTAEELAAAERLLQQATEAAAAADARRTAFEVRRRELSERRDRLAARLAEGERQRLAVAAETVPAGARAAAATALASAERRALECRTAVEAAEQESAARAASRDAAAGRAAAIDGRLTRLRAEAEALAKVAAAPADPALPAALPPILAAVTVEPGFEAAVGALFEDELSAPLAEGDEPDMPACWRDLPPLDAIPPLPDGASALTPKVAAPAALARRLAFAGWVGDEATGRRLQSALEPGQRLVDLHGRLWRWDGFSRVAAAPSATAGHLEQRNRLAALATEIAAAEEEARAADAAAAAARAAWQQAAEGERAARRELHAAEAAFAAARTAEADLAQRAMTVETRLAGLAEAAGRLAADLAETEAETSAAERDFAALPDPGALHSRLDRAREAAVDARRRDAEAHAAVERSEREAVLRRERADALDLEERAWRNRAERSKAHHATLVERQQALAGERDRLAARPAAIAAEAERLGAAIATAAQADRAAGDALAEGETRLRAAVEAARLADRLLTEARERRARCEAVCEGAAEALNRLGREIRERLGIDAEELAELAGLAAGEAPPDAADSAARLDRLLREREAIGPVNLVAEAEAEEVAARIAGLERERGELGEAIARLRRGVAALEQEGRKRLAAAFDRVDEHFATLFARLFGGGRARLELTEDEDPLAAGLEIMASPPGKRLQRLSLLSGGEQALTALALVFAVFLTNPTPICVLDEVDAPLDDANVERFCGLLEEIADAAGTRFLVITHHRITMARVDRLYGVTMAERGVSQLVSVDLARAAQLRQTA
jgi:chromosome segregation protein